ncbi:MAG: glucosamine-6-phosphate deaminase [Pirellulaceae bacterium]
MNSQQSTRTATATRLPCKIFDNVRTLARYVAGIVAGVIRERNALGQTAVLGLPTGSTPVSIYRELIRMHQEEGLDFSRVETFNLDEYYGVASDQLQSYHRWMYDNFFNHINLPAENIHIPDGMVPLDRVETYCREYEESIRRAGGIDVLLLGIGSNGHIGFNEPFSVRNSRTRLCTLDPISRRAMASDFFGEENVPTQAITMGLGTLLEARKVLLIALGEHKAKIIREMAEEGISDRVPASYLQEHPDASVLVDAASASRLKCEITPWAVGNLEWNERTIKRAVLWLCDQTGKSLLKLTDDDFREHDLHQLLRHHGPAQQIGHRVFRWMMDTIEYHPAGREPKKVICFSPHPDDDVISMGGTLIRLVDDGHETHIAYMTSGNIAVFDHDALRVADLVTEYNRRFGIDTERSEELREKVAQSLSNKAPGTPDIDAVLDIKGLIRWGEAKAGALKVGCKEEHLHFLDLPFYRTGTIDKKPWGEDDVAVIRELLERVRPDQIYIAGDLSDPHGTHRVCAEAIFRTLELLQAEAGWVPEVLLYRAPGRSTSCMSWRSRFRSAHAMCCSNARRSSCTKARRTKPCSQGPIRGSFGNERPIVIKRPPTASTR